MARSSFIGLAFVQVFLAIAGTVAWFFVKTRTLEIPPSPPPGTPLYVYEWDFQLITFALVWLPAALISVAILIGVEYIMLKAYQKWLGAAHNRHAP